MSNDLTLAVVPIEVLLDNLLPYVQVPDILRLTRTSKFFSVLCSDDTLWKRKLLSDFNFSGEATARTSGWKFIYRGLFNPRVFVWGEKANGRLGHSNIPNSRAGVPFPTQLRLPSVQIVSLVAGGMSFHALDSGGNVYVWGTMDGSSGGTYKNSGFSLNSKQAKTPLKLKLPAPVRSISCGRLHSSCLDITNAIWTFVNWGRPFRLFSSFLNSDPEFVPRQIECGWTFSSVLTKSGDVFVWWPFSERMSEIIEAKDEEMNRQGNKKAIPTNENVIPCVTWDLDFEPTRLPSIPPLPDLLHTGGEKSTEVTQLIQIAAFDNHIVGLTNHGHVLKYGSLHDETGVIHGRWDYLPLFSEAEKIAENTVFSDSRPGISHVDPPRTLQITHISAHYNQFTAYSTNSESIVLLGDTDSTPTSQPNIIPALQNRSVISVVMGDYHNAALTADGKLLTWGQYSNGALGLGDPFKLEPGSPGAFATAAQRDLAIERGRGVPQTVSIPTEVRFDHTGKKPRDRFCFAATAAGWHTGALVIDLEPDEEDDMDEIHPTAGASGFVRKIFPRRG